jgi:uncharacterized protein DUF6916
MLEEFTVETFSGRVGEQFRISADGSVVFDATLTEARAAGVAEPTSGERVPFSLVFRGPLEPILPQRIYGFEHDALGAFDLFIVPIGPDESGMQYEAVFA